MTLAPRPRLLLLGRNGQVGYELERALAPLGHVIAVDRASVDLANPDSVRDLVRESRPAVIVNAAAYTAVDQAEREEALASKVNAEAPSILAEEAKRHGALVVHYSTDYVFDGTKAGPYLETDACAPLNAYGRTKLQGERGVAHSGAAYLIFRTSWVYGSRGSNFYLTMLRLFKERSSLRIVADQIGAPTWSRGIAESTALVLSQVLAPKPHVDAREASGIYHLTAGGEASWYVFAAAILALHPPPLGSTAPKLAPIPGSEYPTAAKRPANSRLDCGKLRQLFGIALPDWKEALAQVAQAG